MKKVIFAVIATITVLFVLKSQVFASSITWKGCGASQQYSDFYLSGTTCRLKFGYCSNAKTIATIDHLPVLLPIAQGYTSPIRYEELKPEICKGKLPKYIQVSWKNRKKGSACYVSYLNSAGIWKEVKLTKNKQKVKINLYKITNKKNVGKTILKVKYVFKKKGVTITRTVQLAYWRDCELKDVSN